MLLHGVIFLQPVIAAIARKAMALFKIAGA